MVFIMHAMAFDDFAMLSAGWSMLSRWCVPFFFLASSYFFFSGGNKNVYPQKMLKYIKRIAILYLSWFIINIPGIYKIRILDSSSSHKWLNLLKNSLFSSSFTGSWYLLSSIFSCILVVLLSKKLSNKGIVLITLIIEIICIFSSVWSNAHFVAPFQKYLSMFYFPHNIFGGCFYFALGKVLAENKDKIKKYSFKIYFILFLCSALLYAAEVIISKICGCLGSNDKSFMCIFFGLFAFLSSLTMPIHLPQKAALTMRKSSTVIYCAQCNLIVLAEFIVKNVSFPFSHFISFAIVSLIMTVLVFVVLLLQKRIKFAKYLT